ncbi:uncharacterized protein L3040_005410 [Drepanopeziza brunnea f. sp. 'multigermtubi']|uniref:Uncharacterized protein n=1 Tax=Marssonina brunnea f. sp. multigermtubi (strain MB_m1) TaxID=1072389 RepID=K1WXE6_MARBU|nr:uncharacterized protein MBM_04769 [Drepanopeziza brunnea f. sp. 'multigermtubi' MB_m1]EKD17192.1 hypothetical protein MBM_04769 [Drepanopeziza brunnea f. sp. 'multigermtubi' MB_m1]KAJ5041844.1 hypothetical protein L3040_005410 [Drepanopeziza brunnea f. sp. 'multigermtubi']
MSLPFAAQTMGAASHLISRPFDLPLRNTACSHLGRDIFIRFFTVMAPGGFYQVKIYVEMKLALWLEIASILSKERKSILILKIILRGLKSLFYLMYSPGKCLGSIQAKGVVRVRERSNAVRIAGVYLGYRAFYIGYDLVLVSTATSRYPGIPVLEAVEQLRAHLGLVAALRLWA